MELRDFIVTPIVIVVVYIGAYLIRPRVTDLVTRKYFFPALSLKILGALALGFVYQFYYSGGDTFNFHTHGSRHIWEAFMDSPLQGVKMMFSNGEHQGSFFKYSSKIHFFSDSSSFFIIRLAAFIDLFTFSTYSATAILFACISFMGLWMLFLTFYSRYPQLHKWIAIACLFIPSVFFWGSGLLKDTIMMGCLGITTYEVDRLLIKKKLSILHVGLLLLSLFCIFSVKKFMLQAFIPAILFWVYIANLSKIKSTIVKVLMLPLIALITVASSYYTIFKIGEGDVRYSLDKIAETAQITAYDIRYLTGHDAGSGYSLGELDGTFTGMLNLAPSAINVSLFRPYLWEVRNPLMLLSAFESTILLMLTIYILLKKRWKFFTSFKNPDVCFAFIFSIVYAFAVGISTFNFGTLARYKIPILPFFILALILILYENRERNSPELEKTE